VSATDSRGERYSATPPSGPPFIDAIVLGVEQKAQHSRNTPSPERTSCRKGACILAFSSEISLWVLTAPTPSLFLNRKSTPSLPILMHAQTQSISSLPLYGEISLLHAYTKYFL